MDWIARTSRSLVRFPGWQNSTDLCAFFFVETVVFVFHMRRKNTLFVHILHSTHYWQYGIPKFRNKWKSIWIGRDEESPVFFPVRFCATWCNAMPQVESSSVAAGGNWRGHPNVSVFDRWNVRLIHVAVFKIVPFLVQDQRNYSAQFHFADDCAYL